MIKIYEPNIAPYTKSAIDAIQSGWISNQGTYIEKATQKLNEILRCNYSILMANGTCATHCLFLGLRHKYPHITKIYMPNNVYIAAWNCALMVYQHANLEVMKMDADTWNICVTDEYIATLAPNSAVLIVHNLGNIVNVPRLKRLRPDLIFLEDNCEGFLGKYADEQYSGTGDHCLCSSASFYGNKIITSGEGGAFITNDTGVYKHILKVYSQGMSSVKYLHEVHAYNYRMTNIQAAFLYDQLCDIEHILSTKRRIFATYERFLAPLIAANKIALFRREPDTISADWIFSVRILGNTYTTIQETTDFFQDHGVDIRPFFYPIECHTHLAATIADNDDTAHRLNREVIMIPSSPTLTETDQQKVVDVIWQWILMHHHIGIGILDLQTAKNATTILDNFIPTIKSKYFRYFDKRTSDCIQNHTATFLFYDRTCDGDTNIDIDTNNYKWIGYTHIDFCDGKYWFGIYLSENYCGKQLGYLLLNYTLHSVAATATEIHLSVDIENLPAIRLYTKTGFECYQHTDRVYYMRKSQ